MSDTVKPALLLLASTYPRRHGDAEPGFVHELCKRLAQHFRVTAVVPDARDADPSGTFDGVNVIRYRYAPRRWQTLVHGGGMVANLRASRWKWLLLPGFFIGQWLAARKVLRAGGIDVIHAHWLLPQGVIARALARGYGVPYAVTSHGGDLFGLRGAWSTRLKRKVAADCAAMTVVSSAMRDEAARIGLRPPRIEVLPMGADMHDRFVPDAGTARSGNELLFVGRLVAKKGLPHLLAALPEVLRARADVSLSIAGFGPEQAALAQQAKQLGIAAQVRFLGAMQQADLPDLYRRATLLVAPFVRDASGDQEGLPVVLMEAIACGCPVLAGRVAGVEDLFGAQAEAVCIDPKDTHALARAIIARLDDTAGNRALAMQLRDAVAERLDWNTIAESYRRLLVSCVPERINSPSN